MTDEDLGSVNGMHVRIAPWVTLQHLVSVGLAMFDGHQVNFENWRNSAVFKVTASYMHKEYGRVGALHLVRGYTTAMGGVYWWNGSFVKWCFLDLVPESELRALLAVVPPVVLISGGPIGYGGSASRSGNYATTFYTTTYTIS